MGYKFDMIKMLLKRTNSAFKKQIKITKINKKKIKYAQIDNQTPTVIFENGFGVNMKLWDEVFLEISKINSVFAYDRKDNRILKDKILTSDMVVHLREILKDREIKPPYVLVGHSLGGLNMQYFAKKYPEEVAGVILVDSTPPKGLGNPSLMPKSRKKIFEHVNRCADEVLNLPDMEDIPMIALIATYESSRNKYPEKLLIQIDEMKKAMETFPEIYPSCELQSVDSGHFVMYEKPEVVIEAVNEMVEMVSEN